MGLLAHHLMHDEPVEEHPQGRERLLDARGLERAAGQHLDVAGDVLGADVADVSEAALLDPDKKQADLTNVASSGVAVPDRGDEEVEEVSGGILTGRGDECRDVVNGARAGRRERPGGGSAGACWGRCLSLSYRTV